MRRGNTVYESKPVNVLTENDFYTIKPEDGSRCLAVEDSLCVMEGHFATVFRERISKYQPLEPEERANVAIFIAAMLLRTKSYRRAMVSKFSELREFTDQMAEAFAQVPPEKWPRAEPIPRGFSMPADDVLAMTEDLDTLHSLTLTANLQATAQAIYEMKWVFGVALGDDFFVTSDNPVSWTNFDLFAEHGTHGTLSTDMLYHPAAELTTPMSHSISWTAGWKLETDGLFVPLPPDAVAIMRETTLRAARDEVVSHSASYVRSLTWHGEQKLPD